MIALYIRVSTEDQVRNGYSISDQKRQCKNKAGSAETKEYIDDGYSGEFLDRPALTRLRQDVRDGLIEKVVCLDPDRLSRKLMNQLIITDEFERRNVEVVFVNGEYAKTPEGQLFYSMRGAISEFEKAKINERMSRGRREKAKQGKIVKNNHIYGYGFDASKGEMYIIPEEAEIVKLIFDLFTTPNNLVRGINGIAVYLTERKVPTKRGAEVWHRQVVRQILMNEAYTGIFYQNKWNTEGMLGNKYRPPEEKVPMRKRPKEEWIPVKCPAIIDEIQFQQAQRLLSESKRRYAKASVNKYLLSGIVRCGKCGNTMTGRKSRNWGVDVFEYSDRKNTAGAKNKGCGKRIKCEELDKYVWEAVFQWLRAPSEIIAATEEELPQFEQTELTRIEKQLETNSSARKRILDLYAKAIVDISEEEIREKLKELKEERETLEKQREELKKKIEGTKDQRTTRQLLQEAVEYYLSLDADHLEFEHKQNLIRHVVREVRVYDDRVELVPF